MSDPFRDDADAQRARTQALQAEVDRLERERDELKTKLATAEERATTSAREARAADKRAAKRRAKVAKDAEIARGGKPAATKSKRGAVAMGIGAVVVVVVIAVPTCQKNRAHDAWIEASDQRTRDAARWWIYTQIGTCLRQEQRQLDDTAELTAATRDPRDATQAGFRVDEPMLGACPDASETIGTDPTLDATALASAAAWHTATLHALAESKMLADYYNRGDWRDDEFASGPAKWAAFRAAHAELAGATAGVARTLLPAVDARIAAIAEALDHTSAAYWKTTIGARLEAIERARAGGATPAALQALAQAVLADAKAAPLEVRRAVRDVPALAELAATGASAPSIPFNLQNFWGGMSGDDAPFPSLGPEPEPGCDSSSD